MKRSELREHIFKMVFGIEFRLPEELPEQLGLYFEQLENPREKDLDYIRMNKVDLSILRLAVYEMKWDDEVPVGVAIDEAVELAKKYSSDEGPAFVNAVLAKLAV